MCKRELKTHVYLENKNEIMMRENLFEKWKKTRKEYRNRHIVAKQLVWLIWNKSVCYDRLKQESLWLLRTLLQLSLSQKEESDTLKRENIALLRTSTVLVHI